MLLTAALMVAVPVTGAARSSTDCGAAGGSSDGGGNGREYVPSCHFQHLNAFVTLDEQRNSMDVLVRISLVTAKDVSLLYVTLNYAMDVTGIRDEAYGNLTFKRMVGEVLNISLGRNLPAGTWLNISLSYGGEVQNTEDSGASFWDYVGPEGSWVRPYQAFFPYDEERDRTTSRISITLPGNEVAVAPGDAAGTTTDSANGTATYVWESRQPVNGLSFVAGALNRTTVVIGQTPYNVYFLQEHAGSASSFAAELDRISAFYSSMLGPAGYRNLTIVEVPDLFSAYGQTVPSMIWLASRNFAGPFPYRILAHELGHQWWGVDVEGKRFADNWVQEGFAGYFEALYEMAAYGSRGYLDYCRMQYVKQFVESSSPEPVLAGNDYDLAATKGPWVLHMLRYLTGNQAFNRTLHDFHSGFTGRQADLTDFVAAAITANGEHLATFFTFWLYTPGRLDYALSDPVVYQGTGARSRLQFGLESRERAQGLPVDLAFYDAAGRMASFLPKALNVSGPSATVHYEVDYPVDTVKLDPDGWLLDVAPSNNEAPTRTASLDFRVGELRLSPASPLEEENSTLSVNLSSASSEGPSQVEVELLADGLPAGNCSATLAASGRGSVAFNISLAAGTHGLTVVLDPQGIYFETDQSNNLASINVTVRPRPPPLPDLRILPGGIGFAPAAGVGGEAVHLRALVENIGPAAAHNVTVQFWVDSKDTGYAGSSGELSIPARGSALASVPWTALPGRHEVTALAGLPSGNESDTGNNEASGLIYVNARPVALISASRYEVHAGEWVELSGAASTDDVEVVYYLFDLGDGESAGWLPDAVTWHRYLSKGGYQARLKVLDDTGAESDWSSPVTIRVLDEPPAAVLAVRPSAGYVFTSFGFSSMSSDGDGAVVEAVWNFGDGRSARGAQANHTYSSHGDFLVSLSVRDDAGLEARASVVVRVRDSPPMPAISLDKGSARVGERIEFSGRGSGDPDDPPSNLSYLWDFGDGQKASGINASYAFRHAGVYRVVLTVSDGNQSAEKAVTVEARWGAAPLPASQNAGWLPWAVLGALLTAMALLVTAMMIPDDRKRGQEEEE